MKTRKKTYTVEVPQRQIVIKPKNRPTDALAEKIAALQAQAHKEGYEEGYKKGYRESEGKIRKERKVKATEGNKWLTDQERKRTYAQGYNAGRRKGRQDVLDTLGITDRNYSTLSAIATAADAEVEEDEPDDYI
jgi:flagellar biosynthesis/type III secretory pathway protein FliH